MISNVTKSREFFCSKDSGMQSDKKAMFSEQRVIYFRKPIFR